MSTVPARADVRFIANSKLAYSFTFNVDDSPVDLTAKDNVTVVLKTKDSTIFSHSVTGGELTISGASNNKISGTATSTVMDVGARSYELIIFYNDDPDKEIIVMFDVQIFDENSELQSTASDWTIDLDTTSDTATAQASQVVTKRSLLGYREYKADILIEDGDFSSVSRLIVNDFDTVTWANSFSGIETNEDLGAENSNIIGFPYTPYVDDPGAFVYVEYQALTGGEPKVFFRGTDGSGASSFTSIISVHFRVYD